MEYQTPKSTCQLCGSQFTRKGMTRHIKSCMAKRFGSPAKTEGGPLLHLNVSGAFNPDYFLHLLMAETAKLRDLDRFLRDIWLECCGHLSAFTYERFGEDILMMHKIGEILAPGTRLCYQYDFGSTTELSVHAVGRVRGRLEKGKKVQVISRNAQPIVPCDECGEGPAVQICTECLWHDGGWLCEACLPKHECDPYMLLPVLNSPRTGVCGYGGNDE